MKAMSLWCVAGVWALVLSLVRGENSLLPSVEFSDLASPTGQSLNRIADALTTLGALQIRGIPRFREARAAALEGLAKCLQGTSEAPTTKQQQTMNDGSQRISTGASSVRGVAGSFSSSCGQSASTLRQLTDLAVRQLLLALDSFSGRSLPVLQPYKDYEDLLRYGEHLEHLHAYYPSTSSTTPSPQSSTAISNSPTISYHTDGGLFIAMTAGHYTRSITSTSSSTTAGLYIRTAAGLPLRISSDENNDGLDDSLIFMVGEAGARWLAPKLGTPLRAVPHMLVADLAGENAVSRAWFGKMYLPPADSRIPLAEGTHATYKEYREEEKRVLSSKTQTSTLPSACGPSVPVSLTSSNSNGNTAKVIQYGQPQSSTQCNQDNGEPGLYCWMQCNPIPTCSKGQSVQCYNTETKTIADPNDMCGDACQPTCIANSNTDGNGDANSTIPNNGYCTGTGTSMLMAGFKSQALSPLLSVPCINFLLPKWTLNNRWKFALGCLAAFGMGLLVPFINKTRIIASRWKFQSRLQRSLTFIVLYFASTTLGYLCMLLAMTYSVELFIMVLLGLTAGYGTFMIDQPVSVSDPCCDEGDIKIHESGAKGISEGLIGPSGHGFLVQ